MKEWPGHDVSPTPGAEPASDSPLGNGDVIKDDRRETPRLTAENLAYIHLEPDSGAIVLNVSDGGLCFHAVAPLHQTGVVRFWFSLRADQRMEVIGELAWTDETKKTCGLRFTSLPAGAQEQIRKWVSQPTTEPVIRRHSPAPAAAAEAFAPPLLPQLPFPQSDLRPSAWQPSAVQPSAVQPSTVQKTVSQQPALQQPVLQQPVLRQDDWPQVTNLTAAHAPSIPDILASLDRPVIPPPQSVPAEVLPHAAPVLANQAPPGEPTRAVPAPSPVESINPAHSAPAIAEAPRKPRPGLQHPVRRRHGPRARFDVRRVAAVCMVSAMILAAVVLLYPARHQVDGALGGRRDSALPRPDLTAKPPDLTAEPADGQAAPAEPAEARASDRQNQLAEEIRKLEAEYDDAPDGPTGGQPSRRNAPPIQSTHPLQPTRPLHINATRRQSQFPGATPTAVAQAPVPTGTSSTGTHAGPEYTGPTEADLPAPNVLVPNLMQPVPSGERPAPGGLVSNGSSPLGRIAGALFGTNPTKPPESASSSSEIYFDVGEFKDMNWAERATAELSQSGFQAQIVHKGRLWLNSYHVLVGPYLGVEAAQRAQAELALRGFKPRPAR